MALDEPSEIMSVLIDGVMRSVEVSTPEVSVLMVQIGLLINAVPKVMVQVLDALLPVVTRPMPFAPVILGDVPHTVAPTVSTVPVETIELLKVWTAVQLFAFPTAAKVVQVVPPTADTAVTAWPAPQADAPP